MKTVVEYSYVDHGEDGESYFPGCGVAWTDFDEVYTGQGDSALAAAHEALELASHDHEWGDVLMTLAEDEAESFSGTAINTDGNDEWHYYVSIRIKFAGGAK
jgi:hypothetical protein